MSGETQDRFEKDLSSSETDIPETEQIDSCEETGYDGYYDDVLPPDLDRAGEKMDKNLIKKIAAVGIGLLLIVSMCILMLYLL